MLSLSNLTPVREQFDLGNGRFIEFRTKQDFDMQELAAWERLQKTYESVRKMRDKAASEQQHATASAKSDKASRELVGLVLPELPGQMMETLTAGQVDQLASMCIVVASGQYAAGSPSLDELAEAGVRWPDLPPEFIASLTRGQLRMLMAGEVEEAAEKK